MKHLPAYAFQHLSKTVRVTLLDLAGDKLTGSKIELSRGYIFESPAKGFRDPVTTVGVICPATFVVNGLHVEMTFSIGIAPSKRHKKIPNQSDIVMTSIKVEMNDLDSLKTIPTRKLLAAAIRSAGVVVAHYSAGYTGNPMGFNDDGELVALNGVTMTTDDGHQEIVAYRLLNENAAYMYAGVADVVDKDQRLRDVAKIVKQHPYGFEREVSQRIGVTLRQARRLISDARQAGYLEPSTRKAAK